MKTQHVKPGKGGAFAQVEMKSLNKNTKLNERFRSSETVEKASLEETTFNYLYSDETNYFFMDPKTFEQIEIKKETVGDKGKLLTENLQVSVSFYNENPLSIELKKNDVPSPYITVRNNLRALISRSVFYELVDLAETIPIDGVPYLAINSEGEIF